MQMLRKQSCRSCPPTSRSSSRLMAAHDIKTSINTSSTELIQAPYRSELEYACHAVRLASKLCQAVQKQLSDAEKEEKQDESPVTVADYGAQAVVAWALSQSGQSVSMVAEEDSASLIGPEGRPMLERITALVNGVVQQEVPGTSLSPDDVVKLIDLGGSSGGQAGRHWVLDPIDGTRGFVGMRQYSVCLGMLQDGEVQLGVLGCPNLPQGPISDNDGGSGAMSRSQDSDVGCLYLAHKGFGAYYSPLSEPAAPLTRVFVQDVTDFSQAQVMESYETRHSDHSFAAAVAKETGVLKAPLRMDSQVKYGILSRGEAPRVFMRFPPATYREKIWDHAAGFVIVEEAGGKVTDTLGDRLDFSCGRYLDTMKGGIVAGPPNVHAALINAIAAVKSKSSTS